MSLDMGLDERSAIESGDPSGNTSRPAPGARHALAGVLIVFVLLAAAYNLSVPAFEAPDEHTHYFFAQHVAHTGRLPVQTDEADTRGPWEQEGSQPPLYYVMAAPLVTLAGADLDEHELWYNHQNTMGHPALAGNENRFVHAPESEAWPWHGYSLTTHLARFMSTLMGAATVLLVWRIALYVVPGRAWLAVAAAATVAFLPQFVYTSASLTNDNLVILLSTAALALTLRVVDGHDDWLTVAALSIAAGLAPLAKLSGLAVLGFTLLTLVGVAWHRRDVRLLARTAIPVGLVGLILSGWWYVRNWQLYGDVTGISHMLPGHTRRDFELAEWLAGLPSELVGMWYSAWGLFGWFTIMLPTWVYALATLLTLAAAAGLAIAALRRATWLRWAHLAWLGLWAGVVLVSLLRWMTIAKGAHGRLLFPAIAFAAVALVVGWRALAPQRVADRTLATMVSVGFLALSLFSLFGVIRPAFAGPAVISIEDIPETAVPADIVFGEGLRLVAAELPERATAGETVPITLYWRAEESLERDGFVAVRFDQTVLAPDAGAEGGYRSEMVSDQPQLSYLSGGTTPPALLEPGGHVYVDERYITVPELAAPKLESLGSSFECGSWLPIEARVSVHLYEPDADAAWSVTAVGAETPEGQSPELHDWHGYTVIDPAPDLEFAPPNAAYRSGAVLADFDNGIELLATSPGSCQGHAARTWHDGLRPPNEMNAAGVPRAAAPTSAQPTSARVTWLPTTQIDEDLTAFIHVVDEQGQLLATLDRPPATHGPYQTSQWQPGSPLPAVLPWWMFDEAADGQSYSVFVGLYRPGDGSRVPAYQRDGTRWPNDAVELVRVQAPEPEAHHLRRQTAPEASGTDG